MRKMKIYEAKDGKLFLKKRDMKKYEKKRS